MDKQRDVTYRIIFFPKVNQYIGMAWNYDLAILISTDPWDTYTRAKLMLELCCERVNANLRWFDGEYYLHPGSQQLVSRVDTILPSKEMIQEESYNHISHNFD